MVLKGEFLKNIICIVLCISLVFTVVCNGQFFGEAFSSSYKIYENLKKYADINSEESPVKTKDTDSYSVTGFGGGGYESVNAEINTKDISQLEKEAELLFRDYKKTGDIKEKSMGATANTLAYGRLLVDNKTNQKIDIKNYLSKKPSYKKITKEEPYILIYHTHTTEGYELLDQGWYSDSYNSRTKDKSKNMVRVGESLKKALEDMGYKVIHDKNIYDTTYTGAYGRSRRAVEESLKKYPSIQIALDVHRDAIHYDGKVKCKPTAVIDSEKAAQVMIITGCEGGGVDSFPSWKKNLTFALNLQNSIEKESSGLMRPVYFSYRKYNMDLTPCSVLLEFGTDANTLREAVYSARLVGIGLGSLLDAELEKQK